MKPGMQFRAMGINHFHTTSQVIPCDTECDRGCDSAAGTRSRADAKHWAFPDCIGDVLAGGSGYARREVGACAHLDQERNDGA